MIPFPNFSPEIVSFSIGGFEVVLRWYALSYIAGFVCAAYLMKNVTRRKHLWRYRTPPLDINQIESLKKQTEITYKIHVYLNLETLKLKIVYYFQKLYDYTIINYNRYLKPSRAQTVKLPNYWLQNSR